MVDMIVTSKKPLLITEIFRSFSGENIFHLKKHAYQCRHADRISIENHIFPRENEGIYSQEDTKVPCLCQSQSQRTQQFSFWHVAEATHHAQHAG
jgi:hypothetical protein